ncbi:MAG: site-specific DNA-methyltransferase [bacterium]|nr:site-specific DNA-methyltransferase [bacterium]
MSQTTGSCQSTRTIRKAITNLYINASTHLGCYSIGVQQADKPTPLMQRLVQCVPAGGLAFDPFCGSRTTLVASVLEGRAAVDFEASEQYCEIAARRIEAAQRGELLKFQRECFPWVIKSLFVVLIHLNKLGN